VTRVEPTSTPAAKPTPGGVLRLQEAPLLAGTLRHEEVEFEPGFHASGHATPEELLQAIERIGPKEVLPVHTEHREWFQREVKGAGVLLPKEGEQIQLA